MDWSKLTPEEEIERLRVQLAGCSVAALGWATGSNNAQTGDYGYSQAFQDVKDLRRKYEDLAAFCRRQELIASMERHDG